MTLNTTTGTVTAGETATTSLTSTFTAANVAEDSISVRVACAAPSGATCPVMQWYWSPTVDSSSVTQLRAWNGASSNPQVAWLRDSYSVSASAVGAVSVTVSGKVVTTTSTTAGTYTYTIYSMNGAGIAAASTSSNKTATFTLTVNALNSTISGVRTYVGYSDAQSGWYYNQVHRGNGMVASTDSAVVASGGTATSSSISAAAYVNLFAVNSAGETRTASGTVNLCVDTCSITAIISGTGGGLLATGNSSSISRTAGAKAVTLTVNNQPGFGLGSASDDTLTIYADGGAGTATVTFFNGNLSLGSVSVTFTGTAASANIAMMDTVTSVGQLGDSITAIVKDSGGNALTSGTLYVYASDTKVVSGALSTDSAQFTQRAAGLAGAAPACTTYRTALGAFTCDLGFLDTGTATITLRDSWTVAASTWVSNEVVVTVLGNSAKSYTVAFDKATYAPGERAVITITGLDTAGRALSNGVLGTGSSISTTVTPSLGSQLKGTNGTQNADTTTFKGYVLNGVESGVETRVVTMPTYATDVTFEIAYTPALSTTAVVAKGSAKVADPNSAAIAAAQAASDAATDAANEAIDAANAATDAANLAAEAADAATVAAEEARDAADAATAAVEELATQVATLMAALKAQLTTLANTVAKIAKKVKA
jgi:hypothetical protein